MRLSDLTRYRYAPYLDNHPMRPEGEEVSLQAFAILRRGDPHQTHDYLEVPNCSGSDYSGDSVSVANFTTWVERYKAQSVRFYGGYGTYGVMVRADRFSEEMLDDLTSMDDYPVLDENEQERVEQQAIDDAWESWAMSDYKGTLLRRFPEEEVEAVSDEDLRILFDFFAERINENWENETGNSAHIDAEKVGEATLFLVAPDRSR